MTTTATPPQAPTRTSSTSQPSTWRVPIGAFSIPLGLAGLGGAWAAAAQLLHASSVPATVAYGVSTATWVFFTLVYLAGLRSGTDAFRAQLQHPLTGPLTAYVPVTAILLLSHYAPQLGDVAAALCYAMVALLAVNAAALMAHWLRAPQELNAFHPGYLLPLSAGPFIASIGLTTLGHPTVAMGAFGVGIYFWLVLGGLITGRLFFGSPLPQPLLPALSILLSPPATACVAWMAIVRGRIDALEAALGTITMFLLVVQLFFLAEYLQLPFSIQHWVFTFPIAVLGNLGVRWSAELRFAGWRPLAWSAVSISTALILSILAASLLQAVRWLRYPSAQKAAALP